MLALRDAHAPGATRVSVGGTHVLTGGADGVVSLFSSKQWPKSAALWSFKCHEAAVTDVALADALALALSCGRDGRILLHENIFDTAKIVSRLICKVTGEVRCLQLDLERRRLYIAGDSLRCLDMSQEKFQIRTIPLVVPFPLVSLAVSPCGRFIAMASASGELGVVSAAADAGDAPAMTPLVFRAVLSATAKREDAAMYRMSWCAGGSGGGALRLLVPTATEVQVYALEEAASGATMTATRMRAVGGLRDGHLMDLHGALAYPVSKTRMACLLASREGIFIGKVDVKSLGMSRHTSERYDRPHRSDSHAPAHAAAAAAGAAVTDVQVNPATGDVVVGLADGRVSLLRRVSLRAWRPSPSSAATADAPDAEEAEDDDGDVESTKPAAAKSHRDAAAVSITAEARHGHRTHRRATDTAAAARAAEDDFIDDGASDASSAADNSRSDGDDDDDASSESSAASSASSSDSGAAPEDFGRVVVDLKRGGASVRANDVERPSRWRGADGQAALADAEREAERQRGRSRFLDDEAEEASTDTEDEDEEGREGRAGAASAAAAARAAAYDPADDDEEGDDGGSVTGHADDGDDALVSGVRGAGAAGRGSGGVAAMGRMSAVQDYSFQVGATPAGEEGSCYLAYNSVGYIHCSREATTVHFHDISFPAVRVQIRDTIVMGALSPVGAAFITVPADPTEAQASVDEAPRLSVFYHAFTPLGAQSEWRVSLLPGETVRCMAAGIRYVAVATSHYLRLFSLSGLELAVLSKCQRIVTMVGTSSRKLMSSFKADFDPLALITLTGTGELQMEVIDVGARAAALPPRTVPLTELPDGSTHQLQWLGWSEDGLLHVVDTAGVVRMFTEDWGGAWVPVYDPRTLVDQSFALWVYGISESALMAYRYSRHDPSYPAAAASGLSTELVPLFLPLTRTMTEDGLERWDKLLRQQLRSDELKRHSTFYNATIAKYDEVHDHHLLQFFDAALKGQQTTRAMELAMLMELHDRVVKCAQLANTNGYVKLVPKLLALYEMRTSTKQKRRCTLPNKETLASDRKKDELLHKLLGQMLPQDKKSKSSTSEAGDAPEKEAPASPPRTAAAAAGGPATPPITANAALSPSAASTATTADSQPPPPPTSSTARRHISFAKEAPASAAVPSSQRSLGSTTSSTATTAATASTTAAAPAPARKVANPFAKPAAKAEGSGSSSGSSEAPTRAANAVVPLQPPAHVPHQHQARLPTVGGASLPHTPTRTVFTTTSSRSSGSSAATGMGVPTPTTAVTHEQDAATSRSPSDTTPPHSRVSAGHAERTSPAHESGIEPPALALKSAATPGTTVRPVTFVAQELPHTASGHRVSGGPVDPFLEEPPRRMSAPASGLGFLAGGGAASVAGMDSTAETPAVSVQALLDVGHAETEPVARSDSFGEALRKRYRDDEDDEAEGAPLASLPKLLV